MFTGDLEPALVVRLDDDTGAPYDATTADHIRLIGISVRTGEVVFDDIAPEAVVVGNTTVVTHTWVDGETAAPGRILVEPKVYWNPGDRPETFPRVAVDIEAEHEYETATP